MYWAIGLPFVRARLSGPHHSDTHGTPGSTSAGGIFSRTDATEPPTITTVGAPRGKVSGGDLLQRLLAGLDAADGHGHQADHREGGQDGEDRAGAAVPVEQE